MNTLFFLRFGLQPVSEVTQKLQQFFTEKPQFMAAPGCLITIFRTEHSLEQVNEQLCTVQENIGNDSHPITYFLFNISNPDNIELNFPQEFLGPIAEYMNVFKYKSKEKLSKLSIGELQLLLQECVENEDYEKAAEIKNQINKIS